ncbi:MAG: hypothetical protein Q9184_005621, partial [Pyrenodesmia sp. 2 TL-2023]
MALCVLGLDSEDLWHPLVLSPAPQIRAHHSARDAMKMTEMGNQNAAFFPVACRLETLVRSSASPDQTENTLIFEHVRVPFGFERLSSLPVDVVHGAWAKLLRSYVCSDTVSFWLLLSSHDEGAQGIRDMHKLSTVVDDARLCQYHAVSERKWGEWLPDAYQDSLGEGTEELQINTAVHFWVAEEHFTPREADQCTGDSLTQWLDVVLNVGSVDWPHNMSLQYRSSKIGHSYAQSIARTFQTILLEIALHSGGDLGSLDSVSKQDKEKIRSWNARELYSNSALHYLIEATARLKPNAEAICAWDGSMSCTELSAVSSNVARQLIRAGVRLGDMVPFAFEKSQWTVVALLAILKAGAAFVPLHPTHPKPRLQDIMTSAGAKLVVTSEQCRSLFADMGTPALEVSAQTAYSQPPDESEGEIRFPAVSAHDVVFVLFTSGSTGKPKGVVHEHGPISTHAISTGEAVGYRDTRVIQFASHIFDISILDMTTTLIFGGCEVMTRMAADLAMLTPSFANLLQPDDLPTLRTLASCGECYKKEIVHRWKGKVRLLNLYGPAETQFTHLRDVEHDDDTTRPLTVGPLMSTAMSVLVDPDNHERLVPIGAVGEVLVASTTLARGYLNDEHKTRSAFISNPVWAAELGFRDLVFYKTGDLLRYNVGSFDGQFDYVRRKDTQIKVHGQRVEAGEIEHHLGRAVSPASWSPSYRSESKSARVSTESIAIDPDQSLSTDTLRQHLSKSLPNYAIPSECVTIARMPLTSSCKIDRKLVEAWLGSLLSKPLGPSDEKAPCEISPLDEDETTAHAISAAVADMMASRDAEQGLQLRGHDFVLQSSGMDSIQVMSLSMFFRKLYGVKMATEHFHSSSSTVRSLACLIDREDEPDDKDVSDLDISKEIDFHTAEMLEKIKASSRVREARHVFLTGASGYLGSGILRNLLENPIIDVYALMRSSSADEGLETLSGKAKAQGWWQASYSSRLHIWLGGLTKPKLGLSQKHLECLQQEKSEQNSSVDAIIHNEARVHYNTDYHGLQATNLHPTKELLALMAPSLNLTTFIYVSGGRRLTFAEDSTSHAHANGYSQSNFVSERIVRKCMTHPAFASKHLHIVQPGYIIGSPEDGIPNLTDFIWRLVAGCLEIGAYNTDESDHWLFIADVDRVAEAITRPILAHPSPAIVNKVGSSTNNNNSISRILDGLPFSTLWRVLADSFGYTLHPLPQHEWFSRLEAAVLAGGPEHSLFPLLSTLENTAGCVGTAEVVPPEYKNSSARVEEAVTANVRFLIEKGVFPPVEQQQGEGPLKGDASSGMTRGTGSS